MLEDYKAKAVHISLPDICMETNEPPTEMPLTLGGALVRFIPEDMHLPARLFGSLKPYPDRR